MKIDRLEVGMLATNCYLAINEETQEAVLVDPGADAEAVLKMIAEHGAKLVAILLTHGHSDHIGALEEVRQATGAPVYIHEGDVPCLEKPSSNLSIYTLGMSLTCKEAEHVLQGGEELDLGGMQFKVLHTPGHTVGGVCYYNDEFKVAFVGDTIFCESIGRTDFPGGSYKSLINAIKTQLLTLDDKVMLLPGHGPETSVSWERRRNPFLQ